MNNHDEICYEIAIRYDGARCNDWYCEGMFDGRYYSKEGLSLNVEKNGMFLDAGLDGELWEYYDNYSTDELEEKLKEWFS